MKGKLVSRGFQEDGDPADVMVLDVKNDNLRLADVAYLLGQIGSPAAAAGPRLFALVRDERHAQVRYAAAGAIDRIEPAYAARCVVDATTVLEALEDTAPSGRPLAVRAECAR